MCAISHNSDVMETMDVAISAWLNQSIPWTSQLKIHCFRTFLTPRSTSNVDLCTITKTILNCHPPIETYHEIWESFKGDQGSDFKVFVLLLLSMKNSLSFFCRCRRRRLCFHRCPKHTKFNNEQRQKYQMIYLKACIGLFSCFCFGLYFVIVVRMCVALRCVCVWARLGVCDHILRVCARYMFARYYLYAGDCVCIFSTHRGVNVLRTRKNMFIFHITLW